MTALGGPLGPSSTRWRAVDRRDLQTGGLLSYGAAVDQLERTRARSVQLWQELQQARQQRRRTARRAFAAGLLAGVVLAALALLLI